MAPGATGSFSGLCIDCVDAGNDVLAGASGVFLHSLSIGNRNSLLDVQMRLGCRGIAIPVLVLLDF